MRDEQRRRATDEPLENGWVHLAEIILGAALMLVLLTVFLMSRL
jgi:hypothetical protein